MTAAAACPKAMVHGPCGGVQADGSCEIGGPCPFVGPDGSAMPQSRAAWAAVGGGRSTPELGEASAALLAQVVGAVRPFVVADLPSPGPDADEDRRLAAALAGSVDAVLLGDAPWARVMLPPAVRGWNVQREGVTPWCGVNCRDRNRAALQSEIAGLEAIGVPAMHTVTGDHPQLGHRTDAAPVFDLDSTELAALARRTSGLLISAAESPAAPPTADRAARAAAKLAAGAHVLFVNHSSPGRLAAFAAELATLVPHPERPGLPAVPLIACVPLVATVAAADRIARYLHAPPPPHLLDPVTTALTPAAAASAATALAVAHAEQVLAIPGVVGVDLSAPAGPGEAALVTAALADAGRALGVTA